MPDPAKIDKYLYINRTPTWFVRGVYGYGIVAWLLVFYQYFQAAHSDPFYRWIIFPIILIITVYLLLSFFLNLLYKQVDLEEHKYLVQRYWRVFKEPSVDIFLPICGEAMEVLENTWNNVAKLRYRNKRVYVLDDSKEECDEHRLLARSYGFHYMERPNKGEMKKAGNMKYAFERTEGDFILVLDGDFAPHEDFLRETVPYMRDPKVGIVQTPQYFETTKEVHDRSPLAYGAARAQEIFYRIIQVARDRIGAAHCCGTCALYRREALESIGGFVQMGHSEDAHTGFGLTSNGWIVRYIPVILSVGECPDDLHAFFHQQHRWCLGNMVLTLDKKFWQPNIPWRIRLCYMIGFLYNVHFLLLIPLSFQLFWTLILYYSNISLGGGIFFYPYMSFAMYCLIFLPISRLRWGYVYSSFAKIYSNTHAIFSIFLQSIVEWIPTGQKQSAVSAAFRQATKIVAVYVFFYIMLIALSIRGQVINIFDHNYYSVLFWIFFNFFFSSLLLWQMYRTIETRVRAKGDTVSMEAWQFKTAGLYLGASALMFWFLAYS